MILYYYLIHFIDFCQCEKRNMKQIIDQLAVVNFRSEGMTSLQQAWRRRNSVLMAESCARQVWVGTQAEFQDFPSTSGEIISTGVEAYRFLLRLACGLESPKKGETNVKGEIFSRWDKRKQRAVHTRGIDSIFQQLKADSRIISNFFLNDLQVAHYGMIARDLSGFRKDRKAIIVSDINANGGVASNTDWLLRVLNNRARRASLVYVTNPCPAVTQKVLEKALYMQSKGLIDFPVTSVAFDSIPRSIEGVDHVYCDMAMGSHFEADMQMISAWKNRARRGNNFTHFRGCYDPKGSSTSEWLEAELDNYTPPEALFEEAHRRKEKNLLLLDRAETGVDLIVEARQKDEPVSKSRFREMAPALIAA